jgi:serine/threonine-protein kinase
MKPSSEPLLPGARVGRYRVESLLGRGGMGAVYAAEDTALGRRVALKVVTFGEGLEGSKAEEAKARLVREARAAASLEHANVVAVYDVGEHEGAPFLAMELVTGETLRDRMQRPSTADEKIGWLVEIARALEAAHENGIVHRDVKPENVMVKRDGHVKVLDFGIARRAALPVDPEAATEAAAGASLATLTIDGAIIGTPMYMSPEQLHGDKLDGRSDQFAWGVVAYELFAGKTPWVASDAVSLIASILSKEAPPLGDVATDAPLPAVVAIERALRKRGDERFATMSDAGAALSTAPSAPAHVPPPRRRVRLAGAVAAGAVAVALVIGWSTLHDERRSAPVAAASSSSSSSASTPKSVVLTDLPLPKSDVREALVAYKAALQAMRDGTFNAAYDRFQTAEKLDPGLGAAYLHQARQGAWGDKETAELFGKASELRGTLSEHERLLLEAIQPCAQAAGGDDPACVRRVRKLVEEHPEDEDFALELASRLGLYGPFAEWEVAAERAVALDPHDARAHFTLSAARIYRGARARAEEALRACIAATPGVLCPLLAAEYQREAGELDALETTAKTMVARAPDNPDARDIFFEAELCRDQPEATLRGARERRVSITPEHQARFNSFADMLTALRSGDFRMVSSAARRHREQVADSNPLSETQMAAWFEIVAARESGDLKGAANIARDYLDKRATLFGSPGVDDQALDQYITWPMWRALRAAGLASKADVRAERDRMIAEWRPKMGADYLPYLWFATYAGLAFDADEAREALDALPDFGGLPRAFTAMPHEVAIGRVFKLAGKLDDAIVWLRRAAKACWLTMPENTLATFELGEALEEHRDKAEACAAYATVLKRWGNAKPKSVTADEAKKRSAALGCAR